MSCSTVSRDPVPAPKSICIADLSEFPTEVLTLIFIQVLSNSKNLMLTCTAFHRLFNENTVLKNLTPFYKKLNACYLAEKRLKTEEDKDLKIGNTLTIELRCVKGLALLDRLSAERVALKMQNSVEKVRALAWLLSWQEGLTVERRCILMQQGIIACQSTDDTIRSLRAKMALVFSSLPFYPDAAGKLKDQIVSALSQKKRTGGHLLAILPLVKKMSRLFPGDATELAFTLQPDTLALKNNQTRSSLLAMISAITALHEPVKSSALLQETVKDTKKCQPGMKIMGLVDVAMEVASTYPVTALECLNSALDCIFEHKKLITDTLVINIAKTAVLIGGTEGSSVLERTITATQTLLTDYQKARALVKLSHSVDQAKAKGLIIEAEGLTATIHRHWRAKYDALMTKVYISKDPRKASESAELAIEGAKGLPETLKFSTLGEVAQTLSFTNPDRSVQVLDMITPNLSKIDAISLSIRSLKKHVILLHFQKKPSKKSH